MTAKHDLELKAKKAQKFLEQGNKVKIEMVLKGRQKMHQNLAKERLQEFISLIPLKISIEQQPKNEPRGLTMIIGKA